MYKIIGTDAGHCKRGADLGARGNGYKEELLTREVTNSLNRILVKEGIRIINCNIDYSNTVKESLEIRCKNANDNNVDLFVSIHINSGGGTGCEIYTYGGEKHIECIRILENLEKIGIPKRINPIKDGSKFAVIRGTKAKAMLIECFFIDNKRDIDMYIRTGASAIALCIAEGILGKKLSIETKPVTPSKLYKVQVGSYRDRKNAENMKKMLDDKGIPSFITEV